MEILIINSGSSSLKYQLIDSATGEPKAKGVVDRIGIDGSFIKYTAVKNGKEVDVKKEQPIPNHEVGMNLVVELLTDPEVGVIHDPSEIKGVGHRVVHGGEKFVQPTVVTDEVVAEIKRLIPLSPLHNPGALEGIRVAQKLFNKATHVTVFDTAFHQTMPPRAYRYAIPNEYYEKYGLRAYGFHGTSHKYVNGEARKYLNNPHLKNITIHLGNGASMAAVNEEGHCIDTSMGLTPLDGLIMGTRSGQIDPSVAFFLVEELGLGIDEVKNLLNKKSGMLGLTGHSDARDVAALYNSGDANAALCYEMYGYRVRKFIGAYTAALNGLDSIVFTAGLGEHDALTRSFACKNMEFFGIKLDEKKNVELNHASQPVEIQAADSRVKILIIPTNEEWQIVKEIVGLVK
ncbi:acetate kinase [Capnocytophaga sp. HP1101]